MAGFHGILATTLGRAAQVGSVTEHIGQRNVGINLRCAVSPVCDGEITVKIHGFAGEEKLRIAVMGGKAEVTAFTGDCDVEFTHKQAMNALFALVSEERRALPAAVNTWLPLPLFVPEVDND